MTGQFILSPRAQGDVEDIWDQTISRWGVDQAETYLRQLSDRIALIAERPMLGRACPEIRGGYHKYRSGSHILFYRVTADGVDIVRILHQGMDFSLHL